MSGIWTAADSAELDLLFFAFVRAHATHAEGCEMCREPGPWCDRLRGAFDVILEWMRGRELRSKAAWLRSRELERERIRGRVHIAFDERGDVVEFELAPARAAA